MNTRSLRFRLAFWHACLMTAVFLLGFAVMTQALRHYLTVSLTESLLRRTRQIDASLLINAAKTGDAFVVEEIKARYAPQNYDRYIRLSRPDGTVLYESGKAASFDPTGLPLFFGNMRTRQVMLHDGTRLLLVTEHYYEPGGLDYIMEAGAPMQPIEAILHEFLLLMFLGLPLLLGAAVIGGYILVRRALAPVVQMARSAEQTTLHHIATSLPLTGTGDELEQLSRSLNSMIDRLREAFDQNRRFLADASHELRTPLAALRGELESAFDQAGLLPEVRDKIGSALEEVDRLTSIVQNLFALSRLEAGEAQQEWNLFDLARLASGTADQMSLLAEDKGVSVNCKVGQPVQVQGDRARIKQIVVNLLDNAIKYTPAGGSIKLEVQARDDQAILEVADTGIGIPNGALPHVFERFFRVDEARSRDLGGAGLGLAIVKSICLAHGGQVEAASAEGEGSRFTVALPLAKACL